MVPATSRVMMPPDHIAGAMPSQAAAMPLSKLPSSLVALRNRPRTEDTRPRIWSGAAIRTMARRTITLTPSQAPTKNSAAMHR